MGVGTFLIALSYEFSKIEKQPGSPEKPLSDLGTASYSAYWRDAVIEAMIAHQDEMVSIMLLSQWTGMTEYDVIYAITTEKFLRPGGDCALGISEKQLLAWQKRVRKKKMRFDPTRLRWAPSAHSAKKGE
jgi:hypothetical protein